VFIYNELLIFSALVGIYIYVLLYAVYGQSPSILSYIYVYLLVLISYLTWEIISFISRLLACLTSNGKNVMTLSKP